MHQRDGKNGFGLFRQEVMDLVERFIVQNQLQTRFENHRPGQNWFTNFRMRHNLSLKKPRSIEHVRCDQVSPWVVYDFFKRLTGVVKEQNLEGFPNQIFNCDETSFCHDPSKTKIVGAKGVSSERKTAGSVRDNTTILMC
ncbi:hypothetical protein JTB14_029309 [Gonioctena quinquepunctata]|nr:hypothetical protein JTB14_029309 [Gonioctena quinquepunctata]